MGCSAAGRGRHRGLAAHTAAAAVDGRGALAAAGPGRRLAAAGRGLWLAPGRAAPLLHSLPGHGLRALAERFELAFETLAQAGEGHWAWLPAFALVERPLLAEPLAGAQAPAEVAAAQGFGLVAALLRLERQGRHQEIVALRARLRALCPPLFAAYMATR